VECFPTELLAMREIRRLLSAMKQDGSRLRGIAALHPTAAIVRSSSLLSAPTIKKRTETAIEL
jgi:hypothetical protein